jgi:hypothetical protein
VSQILDYAKELSRWSSSDVQREVSHRLKRDGNPLLDMVRAVDPEVDEQQFNDALTANLRRGRFLLLIVGNGIREGVEAIAEYLQLHAGLHFSLGLVELPIYVMPNGDRLVAPRVLARTALITRNVVAVPDGYSLDEVEDPTTVAEIDPERAALGDQSQRFWTEFLDNYLKLDDPEQPKPKPARLGYISFPLPARNSWLTVYRGLHPAKVGIFLSCEQNTPGAYAMRAILDEWKAGGAVKHQLGGTAKLSKTTLGTLDTMIDSLQVGIAGTAGGKGKGVFLARRAGEHLCECSASSHALGGGRLSVARRIEPKPSVLCQPPEVLEPPLTKDRDQISINDAATERVNGIDGDIRRALSWRQHPTNQNPARRRGGCLHLDNRTRRSGAQCAASPPAATAARAHPARKVSGMISAALRPAQSRRGTLSIARRCAVASRALASA